MPNFSGIWTVTQQMQAKGASTWPALPGAPTIGTATAGSALCASVTFTAPACTGYPAGVTGYRVVSTPGCFSNTGASSPIVVSGLTNGTSYTFKAQATNANGYGCLSAASNSITASNAGSQSYTTAGTYSWVAPAGVTSVSVVAVGSGAGGQWNCNAGGSSGQGGGGGGLGYKNNYPVTPGSSYTVVVGAAGVTSGSACGIYGNDSYFVCTSVVKGGRGLNNSQYSTYTGDGGGGGGAGGAGQAGSGGFGGGGGGAGGYSNPGGNAYGGRAGFSFGCFAGSSGQCGGGGGGGRTQTASYSSGAGGGVGLLGRGSSGAGGAFATPAGGGGGGSGGAAGQPGKSSGASSGGAYGGGGAGGSQNGVGYSGGVGAVRIIWPGTTRYFPSTCAGAP